jgi:hypothetical protein
MLNLLNREKRYALRREYFGRLINIFLGITIFSLVYGAVLLFSNSFLVSFEKMAVESEAKNLSDSSRQKELDEYEKKLARIESEYNLFSKQSISPTSILARIKQKEISGITLNSIVIQKTAEEGVVRLEMKGVAKTRDILINYSNSLKTDEIFKDVTIPFSSLAKNTDIPFSISVDAKINKSDE